VNRRPTRLAGVEYAFAGNWSARFEYDYIGINSQSFSATGLPVPPFVVASQTFSGSNRSLQLVNLGINYKFGY
jgi:opacity protein-like surface antigen